MRVLVTGAGGFAGQHLVRALLADEGVELWGATLGGAAPASSLLSPAERERVRWIPLDVTDHGSVRVAVRRSAPERVFHLAGQASVGRSFADPLGTWDVNATGTLRLMQALQEREGRGVRVLMVSSAEVYGPVPEPEQPIREDRPLCPISPYGASKAGAEAAALQAAASGGVEVVIARSYNHAGPGQDERFLLPSIAQQLGRIGRGDRPPELRVGNLETYRDFSDVRDVVRGYLVLAERAENRGIYNVCAGESVSLHQLVEDLVRLSGTGARIVVDPERVRPTDIRLLVGDPSRLRALGWAPEIPLERTLRDLLNGAGAPRG